MKKRQVCCNAIWIVILFLPSCCIKSHQEICTTAQIHMKKLQRHFSSGRVGDISTLINETRIISAQLKNAGMTDQARKFDSYIDVLMFGNRTIDESLNDVITLAKQKDNHICTPLQRIKSKILNWF